MLDIRELRASIPGKEILKGLTLSVPSGEVHAIMGPNGAGKSTLSQVLAGRADYEISGAAAMNGEDLLALLPEERAAKGLFMSFQYPLELPGVPAMTFVRTALNAQRKARGEAELSPGEFLKKVREVAKKLNMPDDMLRRAFNVGFSGGEKKRMEMLQMAMFAPRIAILDETDSGLDIDALRNVYDAINALRAPDRSILLITHYERLLEYVKPDRIHVLVAGRIVDSGGCRRRRRG